MRFINLRQGAFWSAFAAAIVKRNGELSRREVAHWLERRVCSQREVSSSLKPLLGEVFADHIRAYSHWGYIDTDTLVANLSKWILPADLSMFDVITWARYQPPRV